MMLCCYAAAIFAAAAAMSIFSLRYRFSMPPFFY